MACVDCESAQAAGARFCPQCGEQLRPEDIAPASRILRDDGPGAEARARRLAFERLTAEVLARFVDCPTARIDECITENFAEVGSFLELDAVALRVLDETSDSLILTHRWAADPAIRHFPIGHSLSAGETPWLHQLVQSGRAFRAQDLDDIPPEAKQERNLFQREGTTGMMLLPLSHMGTPAGYLFIQIRQENRQLSSDDDTLLRFLGSSISSALERRRAEEELDHRISFERLAAELSAELINCPTARIDEYIGGALRQVGSFLDLDSVALRLLDETGARAILTHRWVSATAEINFPIGHALLMSEVPWFVQQLKNGETFHVQSIADIPPEAKREREFFRFERTTASALVPLGRAENPIGALYLQARKWKKRLSSADDALLRFVGSSIFRGLERKRAEEVLTETIRERTGELTASLERMENLNTVLTQASTARDRFLSTMSHELRTPTSAVLGYADMLAGRYYGDLNDKQEEYVAAIATSGSSLLALLDNLLEVTKIDAGAVELRPESIAVQDLLEASVATLRARAEKQGVAVTIEASTDLPMLMCDPARVDQILLNLLNNALKYTAEGGRVTLRARREDALARIEVSDTGIGVTPEHQATIFAEFEQADRKRDEALGGIGITPEHQTTIFAEFEQADRERDEALGGVGMGLPLCRRLVHLHGGQIGLESTAGEGSTFWFTLPCAEDAPVATASARPAAGAEDLSPAPTAKLILVAEDNRMNLGLILDMLEVLGFRGRGVPNGVAALKTAQEMRPDVILMDIRMPVMDGLEATRRIHALPECAEIPIVALTAGAGPEEQEQCRAAGCLGFLSKPLEMAALNSELKRHVRSPEGS